MAHPFFLVDAFCEGPFSGNPAGVCLLDLPAEEAWMQAVASEVNQAETAFVWPIGDAWGLRWFTPTAEVDLCGHATLAASCALWESGCLHTSESAVFDTKSGRLVCQKVGASIEMAFPEEPPGQAALPPGLSALFPGGWTWAGANRMDWLVEVADEAVVRGFQPDLSLVHSLGMRGLIVTARGQDGHVDFVSRFFAPQVGIPEDPVTGSAHCALAPYWGPKLGKAEMTARQLSRRGGLVHVRLEGGKVVLGGKALVRVVGELSG